MKREKTLYEYLESYDRLSGSKRFLFSESSSYSVHQAKTVVDALTSELEKEGVFEGSLLALKACRTSEAFLLLLALENLGATVFLTDSHFACSDFLEKTGIDIKVSGCLSDRAENEEKPEWIFQKADGREIPLSFSSEENEPAGVLKSGGFKSAKGRIVVFTSGSTGIEKAVVLSQSAFISNSLSTWPLGDYREDDINMALLPFSHVFGLALLITALVTRHAVFIPKRKDAFSVLEDIEVFGITRLNGVPTLYLDLAEKKEAMSYDTSSLRVGLIGGGPYTKEQFDYMEKTLHMTLLPVYGMSECIGISISSSFDSASLREQGVGRVYPQNQIEFLSPEGQKAEEGEIAVKSPFRMDGYFSNPAETRNQQTEDGFLKTGDLGYLSREGILVITGRKKDLIIRAGENISPVKIENALLSFREIRLASVIGLSDKRLGEKIVAAVTFRSPSELTEQEIKERLNDLLSKNEIPERIFCLRDMPFTSSGKIDKPALKRIVLAL